MEKFKGEIVHTHDYKYSAPYKNKTAIVVGVGNSGIDAAVDLSHVTSPVSTCNYIIIAKTFLIVCVFDGLFIVNVNF